MFENRVLISNQVHGLVTLPVEAFFSSENRFPAVLMLHGFGSNKDEVGDLYKKIATVLAQEGVASLRIDFRGYGDSCEKPEEHSVGDMLDDAKMAFEYLLNHDRISREKIVVIGFSLGAAIALLLSAEENIDFLILISPALNLFKDLGSFLGEEVMDELERCESFVQVDLGWRTINIGKSFYNSLKTLDPQKPVSLYKNSLFVIAGENDFSKDNALFILENSGLIEKKIEIIPESDHVFNLSGLKNVEEKVAKEASNFFLKNK